MTDALKKQRQRLPATNKAPMSTADDDLLQRALARDPHAIKKIERGARTAMRPLNLQERRFVDGMLAHGNVRQAATDAGFKDPDYGYELLRRPVIKAALYGQTAKAALRAGVNLSKERLLTELQWAITSSKRAARRLHVVKKKCECGREVAIEVRAAPREIANLAIAVTRSVEVAAKVTGQIQRTPDRGAQVVATSYGEVVDMLREDPKAFTPAQRAELREAATIDRGRIDELLTLLTEPTH